MNRPEINVTPLIDVLLVLLIIFMVVAPIRPSSFNARIPSKPKTSSSIEIHPDTLVVNLVSSSEILLNREMINATIDDTTALTSRLRDIFEQRKANHSVQRTVFIKAPRSSSYGDVAKMIDAIKAAGADPVSLQIDELD